MRQTCRLRILNVPTVKHRSVVGLMRSRDRFLSYTTVDKKKRAPPTTLPTDLPTTCLRSYVRSPTRPTQLSQIYFTTPLCRLRTWIVMCGRDTHNPTYLLTFKIPRCVVDYSNLLLLEDRAITYCSPTLCCSRHLHLYLQTYDKTAPVPQLTSNLPTALLHPSYLLPSNSIDRIYPSSKATILGTTYSPPPTAKATARATSFINYPLCRATAGSRDTDFPT